MNAKLVLMLAALSLLLTCSFVSTSWGNLITFDDFSTGADPGTGVTNGYNDLNWQNLHVLNAPLETLAYSTSGYTYGMVSASNVVYNGNGFPAAIDSIDTNFNLLSVYLTGAWDNNLNITVQGLNGATLLYSTSIVAQATAATLFTFNWQNLSSLTLSSTFGQSAGFLGGAGVQFVMDNLNVTFVPEPSTLLLSGLGVLTLMALLRRKAKPCLYK
jgi:PEP-CTERM motif